VSLDNVTKIRDGRHLKTIIEEEYRTSEFHETDNLNTKTIKEAVDSYEKTFIVIRQALENNEQYCCDDENDRLSIAQVISDTLRKSQLIRKDL
jgi:hypothetical protein